MMFLLRLTPFFLLVLGLAACENNTSSGKGPKIGITSDATATGDSTYGGIKPGGDVPASSGVDTQGTPDDGVKEICDNALDDDGDTQVDCGDSDCLAAPGCGHPKETVCDNGKDDDGDSFADCTDVDCKASPACAAGAEDCKNGVDDDGDKFIDCNDNDCLADAKCLESFEICNNNIDDDKDGLKDCADDDCSKFPTCAAGGAEICDNGKDDDGDGFADCSDSECKSSPKCAVKTEICDNFADDDGDGLADCKDAECKGLPACGGGTGTKENCTNFADDDGDGLADCDDSECKSNPLCGSSGGGGACCVASDGPGCADAAVESCVCAFDAYCCDSQWDSQCVSEADGCDAGCDGGGSQSEVCDNGVDDDDDFATDCDDSDCAASPACATSGGSCCEESTEPGCADAAIQSCVCELDIYCCNAMWDDVCVGEADDCGGGCSGGGSDPEVCDNGFDDDGDFATDCDDGDCADDPSCAPSGGGDCCTGSGEPGCSDASIQSCVCDMDSFCCSNAWDDQCVGEAAECGGCGGGEPTGEICDNGVDDDGNGAVDCADAHCVEVPSCAPPVSGACCTEGEGPGCPGDSAVEACVCGQDPFCCDTAWDDLCVGQVPKCGGACGVAAELCGNGVDDDGDDATDCEDDDCAADPGCAPVAGACCEATSGPGCAESAAIEACVCGFDEFCCNNSWDSICVDEVAECGSSCAGAAPPNACCETSTEPGCWESAAVEQCVCQDDPYCCDVQWDSLCTGAAGSCGSSCL